MASAGAPDRARPVNTMRYRLSVPSSVATGTFSEFAAARHKMNPQPLRSSALAPHASTCASCQATRA